MRIGDWNVDEIAKEMREEEERRIRMLQEQMMKGCSNCSQCDDYHGCTKCESLMD